MLSKRVSAFVAIALAASSAASAASFKAGLGLGLDAMLGDYRHAAYAQYKGAAPSAGRVEGRAGFELLSEDDFTFATFDWIGRHDAATAGMEGASGLATVGRRGSWQAKLIYGAGDTVSLLGVPTLYDGASLGKGLLTLDPALQAGIQASSAATLVGALRAGLGRANAVDLSVRREREGIALSWSPAKWASLSLRAQQEKRTGAQPYSANFGGNSSLQIPAPVDDAHTSLEAGLELSKGGSAAVLQWRRSQYYNAVESVTYANPFRASDRYVTFTVRSQAPNTLGPLYGRSSLAPSNTCDHASVALHQSGLPAATRLTATWDASWARQSAPLLPFTTAATLAGVPGTPSAPALPIGDAQAAVDAWRGRLAIDSRPWPQLRLAGHGQRSARTNTSPGAVFPVYVAFDTQLVTSTPMVTLPYVSSWASEGGAEMGLELPWALSMELGYDREREEFTNGTASALDEETWSAALSHRSSAWSRLRLGLERSWRKSEQPEPAYPDMRYMQKHYAADRSRSVSTGAWDLYFEGLQLEAGTQLSHRVDAFESNWFGLLREESSTVSFSLGWAPWRTLELNGSVSLEERVLRQKQRSFTASKGNPYAASAAYPEPRDDPNNYNVDDYERSQALEWEATIYLMPDVWDLHLGGSYALTRGWVDIYSPVGPAALDNSPWPLSGFANVDDSKELRLEASTRWQVFDALALTAGYRHEAWEADDFNYDGYEQVAATAAGAYNGVMTFTILPATYVVQTLHASLDYGF